MEFTATQGKILVEMNGNYGIESIIPAVFLKFAKNLAQNILWYRSSIKLVGRLRYAKLYIFKKG